MKFWGLRTHNLKNLNLELEHGKIIVLAGPSGSGKSSLAKDSIYAESLRSYVDSLGLPPSLIPKYDAEMDSVQGLIPTLCLDASQDQFHPNTRLGDLSDAHLWLRQLFSQYGTWHCPTCNKALRTWTAHQASQEIIEEFEGERARLCVDLDNGEMDPQFAEIWMQKGYVRAWQEEMEIELADWKVDQNLCLIVDRIKIQASQKDRLAEALHLAWQIRPHCAVMINGEKREYSPEARCNSHQFMGHELRPYFWNNRKAQSACAQCQGKGCTACQETGLSPLSLQVQLMDLSWQEIQKMEIGQLIEILNKIKDLHPQLGAQRIIKEALQRLISLSDLGLGYLQLGRLSSTLSTGERQRARLAALLGQNLSGMCYVLDEVSAGLHPKDLSLLMLHLQKLKEKGNTLLLIDHQMQILEIADQVIEMGPKAGDAGGEILFQGTFAELKSFAQTQVLAPLPTPLGPMIKEASLVLKGAKGRNLNIDEVRFVEGGINVVLGVSGAGKSNLVLETLVPALQNKLDLAQEIGLDLESIHCTSIKDVLWIEAGVHRGSKRSSPASMLGLLDEIRILLASLTEAQVAGFKTSHFSPNIKGGRCEVCKGEGVLVSEMGPLGICEEECQECLGKGFKPEILKIRFKGKNISEMLQMTLAQALEFFRNHPKIFAKLKGPELLGLGYLEMGRSCMSLSAGEMQRLRLAKEFQRPKSKPTLFVLDEPSRGLFHLDLLKLQAYLKMLQEAGHTLILIDHQPALWSCADWVVELGPGAGKQGGSVIYQGPRPLNFYH